MNWFMDLINGWESDMKHRHKHKHGKPHDYPEQLKQLKELAMATQADVNALAARLNSLVTRIDALPIGSTSPSDLDITGVAAATTDIENVVASKEAQV